MTEQQLYMSAPYVLSTGSWLQFSFGRKSCSQIVAVGEYFERFGRFNTCSEMIGRHKRKVP